VCHDTGCLRSHGRCQIGRGWTLCCIVLQCVAVWDSVCCSVLQHVALCCIVLQCVAVRGSVCESERTTTSQSLLPNWERMGPVLQCGAVCCNALQRIALSCCVLQCVAVCGNVYEWVHHYTTFTAAELGEDGPCFAVCGSVL